MDKKPTIKTIAKIAGVSHVAVSKALKGAPDISKETAERIRRISEEIGYKPNINARNLSSRKTSVIGMIVPSLGENTAYNALFNEVSLNAAKNDYCVMLGSSHRSKTLEEKHCKMMVENQVGALIISTCSSDTSHIKKICDDHVPVIYIGGKTDPNEPIALLCDYYGSGVQVVDYLYGLGHREIAFLAYDPHNLTIKQKRDGFSDRMTFYGLTPRIYTIGEASDTIRAGEEAIDMFVKTDTMPTAIWCASDLMAVGVLNTLSRYGIQVPESVSVIGHDNLYFDVFPNFLLTTLHTPIEKIAESATKLAIELALGESVTSTLNQTFKTSLLIRGTTAPPPK